MIFVISELCLSAELDGRCILKNLLFQGELLLLCAVLQDSIEFFVSARPENRPELLSRLDRRSEDRAKDAEHIFVVVADSGLPNSEIVSLKSYVVEEVR